MRAARLRTRIRQVDPIRQRWLAALALILLLLLMLAAFIAGQRWSRTPSVPLQDGLLPLQAQIARLETRRDIDQGTIRVLRRDLSEARAKLEELQGELTFYRGVMAPEDADAWLLLRAPVLLPGAEAGVWQYQFVVQQGAGGDAVRKGTLQVLVLGSREGSPVEMTLASLSDEVADDALRLGFRYFQKIEGRLQLPDDVQPVAIVLDATLTAPRSYTVSRRFPWPSVAAEPDADPDQGPDPDEFDE